MRAGVPFFLRFTSKFFLEILPAALASVIGGFLFAQYHSSAPVPKPVPELVSSLPADRLATMVEEEHTMLLDYLKRDHAAEKPGPSQATPAVSGEAAKPRVATAKEAPKESPKEATKDSVVKVRRPPPAAEERTASIPMSPPAKPVAPAPAPAATAAVPAPASAPATVASVVPAAASPTTPIDGITTGALAVAAPPARSDSHDPLVIGERDRALLADIRPKAPDAPESRGVIGSVLFGASAIKDKAINATGDAVTFVVHDIPSRVLSSGEKPDVAHEAPAPDEAASEAPPQAAPIQRLTETTW
jgi:hypothetical protein